MPSHRPNRVAVIGAGISGVAVAAHLKQEGLEVTVFERSSAAGGIWLLDERKPLEPRYPSITASDAEESYDGISAGNTTIAEALRQAPPGPCYVGLKNNVGTRLLQTTLNPFPSGTPDFVSHIVLRDYIQDTAVQTGVKSLTHFDTEVKSVSKSGKKWSVESLDLITDGASHAKRAEEFDAVVVASGHYHAPRVPDISGLSNWKRKWPDRVQHSKAYRSPDDFNGTGKNFLLIGGSVSATDIARELGPQAHNIYQSHRNGAFDLPASLLPENAIRIEEIESFDIPAEGKTTDLSSELDPIPATVTLKSGHKLCDLHHVILCTGYHISLPYLPHLHADNVRPENANNEVLVTDGLQYHNLHKDIFYIPDPSLVFVGVPYFTATFTLFEFQAMVVAKVFSGQAKLPTEAEMRQEYQSRVAAKGYGKAFHSLRDKEVEYVNELLEWVNRDLEQEGLRKLDGHSKIWHEAKEEQAERIKAMFSGEAQPGKPIEVVCY